jgi:hypothetical protein
VETFTPYNQILISKDQLCTVCPIWIFIFDTDQVRIDSVSYALRITLRGEILEGLYPVLYVYLENMLLP